MITGISMVDRLNHVADMLNQKRGSLNDCHGGHAESAMGLAVSTHNNACSTP